MWPWVNIKVFSLRGEDLQCIKPFFLQWCVSWGGIRWEILVQQMKEWLWHQRERAEPRVCVNHGGLLCSFSHTGCLQCLPEVDPSLHHHQHRPAPPQLAPAAPSADLQQVATFEHGTDCCDLTAIKCQMKLMDSNCQRAEAYSTQWIIVMEWVMSWLCAAPLLFLHLKEKDLCITSVCIFDDVMSQWQKVGLMFARTNIQR